MLRRIKSAGSLTAVARSAANSTTHTVLPASPIQQSQNRSLASAVLLSSQRNWKGETVAGLKSELKKRGLSQQGNKATLIARLSSADVTSYLPPTPSTPSNSRSNTTPKSTHTRSLSTTAASLAPSSKSLPKEDTGADSAPSTTDTVTTSGPDVSSKTTEAPPKDEVTPEQVTSAPGLPVSEVTSTKEVQQMDVELPDVRSESEVQQIIPSTPDNFQSNTTNPPPPSETPEDASPKVMTVASASTHPAGGPVHNNHKSSDAHSHELDIEKKASEAAQAAEDSIPSLTNALGNIITSPIRAWKSTGVKLPTVGMPKGESSGEYKANDEPLNGEERRGAYILGGIAAAAIFLGGPNVMFFGKKEKHEGHSSEGKGKDGKGKGKDGKNEGKKGVVGDKEWEKASGAGIVGHGARKD